MTEPTPAALPDDVVVERTEVLEPTIVDDPTREELRTVTDGTQDPPVTYEDTRRGAPPA